MENYKPTRIEFGLNTIACIFPESTENQKSEWSAFFAHAEESEHRTLGHQENGLFHYDVYVKAFNFHSRLADFLRYENSVGRKTVVCLPFKIDWEKEVLTEIIQYWNEDGFRKTDPEYIVHSTSIECGEHIVKDGKLKSFKRLREEGYFTGKRLGHSELGEPEDFKEHINFAPWKSIWAEVVVSSNQNGRFVTPDEEYEPGFRFYFDAVKIANDKKLLRTGNGIPACCDILDIEPYLITYQTVHTLDIPISERLTPRSFTDVANRRFKEILLSRGITL